MNFDKYKNNLNYASFKYDPIVHNTWVQEEKRLISLFHHDLLYSFSNSKFSNEFLEPVYQYAWDRGHSYGYNEVVIIFEEIIEQIVNPMLKELDQPEWKEN
jgi:hypothetical protein